MPFDNEKRIISGQEAHKLFQSGVDKWNEWTSNHKDWSVDFSNIDFARGGSAGPTFDFSFFRFATGGVKFENVNFGDNPVSFEGAIFLGGNVSFNKCHFGAGLLNFKKSQFRCETLSFFETNFASNCNFTEIDFGDTRIEFQHIDCPNCRFLFQGSKFGKGNFGFYRSSFLNTDFFFEGCQFSCGGFTFHKTEIGNGNLNFVGTNFGNGPVKIDSSKFGTGEITLNYCNISGSASFTELKEVNSLSRFSMKGATFGRTLEISANEPFGCVIDLTQTKLTNQVTLDGVRCSVSRKNWWQFFQKIEDSKEADRFRRLKEIALQNRHHNQALDFHVGELQANRWQGSSKIANFMAALLEFFYWALGNYGRSVALPIIWIFVALTAFGASYTALIVQNFSEWCEKFELGIAFSSGQMLSFIPINMSAREALTKSMFGAELLPNTIILLGTIQSIIAIILIFLLGLGLRNKFRV